MGFFDQAAGVLRGTTNIQPDAIGAKLVSTSAFLGKIIFYFGIAAAIGSVIYVFMFKYRVRVDIHKYAKGKLVEIKSDFAREVTDKHNRRKLHLFKSLKNIPIPELKYRMKKGKKDYYILIEDDNGNLHACDIDMFVMESKTKFERPQMWKNYFGITRYANEEVKETAKELKKEYKGLIKKEKDKIKRGALSLELNEKLRTLSFIEVEDQEISSKIKPIPQERYAWLLQDARDQEELIKKKDEFWERVKWAAPYISIVIAFLLFFFGFKYLAQIGSSVGSGLEAVARNCLGR